MLGQKVDEGEDVEDGKRANGDEVRKVPIQSAHVSIFPKRKQEEIRGKQHKDKQRRKV